MRVAVCVSGALRGDLCSLKNLKQKIIDPLNADVFFHTWSSYYSWPGICGDANVVFRLFGPVAQDLLPPQYRKLSEFKKAFPSAFSILEKEVISDFPIGDIKDILNPKVISIEDEKSFENDFVSLINCRNNPPAQLKMFYSMYQSFSLMQRFEIERNYEYDFVVRIRPDILIDQAIDLDFVQSIGANEVAIELYDYGPTDQFFIAKNKTMKRIVSLWNEITHYKELSPFARYPSIRSHYLLLLWLIKNNIFIKKMKVNRKIYGSTCSCVPDISDALRDDIGDNQSLKPFCEFFSQIK